MKVSIVYVTGRREPRFSWFIDSLARQTTPEQRAEIELIVIDGHCWGADIAKAFCRGEPEIHFAYPVNHDSWRRGELFNIVDCRFPNFLHIPPMPIAWQGPFRQTNRDFFCASNSRNSAFVVAKAPYLVFVDDLSVLLPNYMNQVWHAAKDNYIVCGAYKKVLELNVVDGEVVSYKPNLNADGNDIGLDSRWGRGSDGGVVPCAGGALYGCSFGIPIEAALEVDGFDGVGNGGGFEDCDAGLRLERAGWPFFYNRNMCTLESEEDHHIGEQAAKFRKLVSKDRLPPDYAIYSVPNKAEMYYSDHVILNRLCNETDRITPILGSNLRALRERYQATGLVPIPREPVRDWRDSKLLSEL